MQRATALGRLAAGLALLLLIGAPARAADDGITNEVEDLRDTVGGLLAELSYSEGLTSGEVAELRGELEEVHSRLDALADRLAREQDLTAGGRPGGWQPYEDVEITSEPPEAVFSVWRPDVKLSLEFGDYGELKVGVAHNGYNALCRLFKAYNGGVNVNLVSHDDGGIVVSVEDELGSHEFLIENGGLGPVFVRGRQDSGADSAAAPPQPPPSG